MTSPLILCGLELARPDTHVLDTALLYAKELGGEVLGVHVLGTQALAGAERPSAEVLASSPAARAMVAKLDERAAQAKEGLEAIRRSRATFGVPLEVRSEEGRPFEALVRVASEAAAAGRDVLLVVGSGRMQGSLMERLLGSTADQLLRHAEQPVLVVPHGLDAEHGKTRSPHGGQWLVAVDDSEPSARALTLAARWSACTRSALALVHASSDHEARRAMRALVGASTDPRVAALAEDVAIVEDTPASAILGQAGLVDANVIVLGSHGRSGLARAFLGSVAASVVKGASVPVLCVR